MFIGYNKARRSGLAEKDFPFGVSMVNPLRIRALRLSLARKTKPHSFAGQDIMASQLASPVIYKL
jgi:hypothetical protein